MLQDFANPEVAPLIQKYPEDVNGRPISEIWQVPGGRWHEIPRNMLMPSVVVGTKHFYIHKVAELNDGQWIVPQIWIEQDTKTYADSYVITRNANVSDYHIMLMRLLKRHSLNYLLVMRLLGS